MKRVSTILLMMAGWARAQDALSLSEAVRVALSTNKAIDAATASRKGAEMRILQAKSGQLPKVNYAESWTRSDNPVFVFGSLLTQGQFAARNFDINSLNRPAFTNNFQSLVTADQVLYDARQTRHAVRSAELGKDLASEDSRRTEMEVVAGVARAYYDSLLSVEQFKATLESVRSAEADLERAQAVRSAGLSTDADLLSIRVHVAGVQERKIRREMEVEVARAALNDAMGLPLEAPHRLTTTLGEMPATAGSLADEQRSAIEHRPEARQAKFVTSLAETQAARARSALLPQVNLHAAYEADRQRFVTRGGDNWLVSVGLRWNLFNGLGDRARIRESDFAVQRTAAEKARADSTIRLQVHRAHAELRAATERIAAAQASVAQARESLRIVQNRYQAGLGNVTELIRTEAVLLETRTRQLEAVRDARVSAVMLELAAGRLTADSEILKELR